jgi:hypothetical protein
MTIDDWDSLTDRMRAKLPAGADTFAKLEEEVAELREAPADLEEMADIIICVGTLAAEQGFSWHALLGVVDAKLVVNAFRNWAVLPDGRAHHY